MVYRLKHLVGDFLHRMQMSLTLLIMTLIVLNILDFIQKYFFTEIDLLPYLFLSILVDMVAGMVRAHQNNTLCVAEAVKKPVIKVI